MTIDSTDNNEVIALPSDDSQSVIQAVDNNGDNGGGDPGAPSGDDAAAE